MEKRIADRERRVTRVNILRSHCCPAVARHLGGVAGAVKSRPRQCSGAPGFYPFADASSRFIEDSVRASLVARRFLIRSNHGPNCGIVSAYSSVGICIYMDWMPTRPGPVKRFQTS